MKVVRSVCSRPTRRAVLLTHKGLGSVLEFIVLWFRAYFYINSFIQRHLVVQNIYIIYLRYMHRLFWHATMNWRFHVLDKVGHLKNTNWLVMTFEGLKAFDFEPVFGIVYTMYNVIVSQIFISKTLIQFTLFYCFAKSTAALDSAVQVPMCYVHHVVHMLCTYYCIVGETNRISYIHNIEVTVPKSTWLCGFLSPNSETHIRLWESYSKTQLCKTTII